MTAPGKVSAWKARNSLLPLEQQGMGTQGSVNMVSYALPEEITFCTMSPWFLIPLCLALQHHGVACSLLFWCVRVSPACPQGTGWLPRGWLAPACLRQEACMTILSFPRWLCSKAASYICQDWSPKLRACQDFA